MSDFKVIETQEEFDKIIKSRLAQKEREVEERYKDYLSPDKADAIKADYEKQIEDAKRSLTETQDKLKAFDSTVSELTKRAESAENSLLKNRIAYENNISIGSAHRLVGATEEELKADAIKFKEEQKQQSATSAPPLHISNNNNPSAASGNGMASLLEGINSQLAQT